MRHTCSDCGVLEGQLHLDVCDQERCPICGGQFISCDCNPIKQNRVARTPFVWWPFMCQRCGVIDPDIFMVPDREWKKVVGPDVDKVLCRKCYDEVKGYVEGK